MKRVLLIILTTSLFSVYSQNIDHSLIEIKQIGKHFKNNFLNLQLSSKKIYYFEPSGLISRIIKYGRHDYAYLSVIGRVENYRYDSNMVIETDTTYYSESDEVFNIVIDTLSSDFIMRKFLYDSKYNEYDSDLRLVRSANDYRQVKKYDYKHNGLISRITYYYSDDENKLFKTSQLTFLRGKVRDLSKETIERINNFILWQHELGI